MVSYIVLLSERESEEEKGPSLTTLYISSARVTFGVETESPDFPGKIRVSWSGLRVRVNITVWDADGGIVLSQLETAKSVGRGPSEMSTDVSIPQESKIITIRRITEGANYGAGIGMKVLASSMMEFYGLDVEGGIKVTTAKKRRHTIEYLGASDTAGYCVDGAENQPGVYLDGWEYDNCDAATPALLGYHFDTNVHVVAEGGLGLIQNAPGEGKETLRDFWNNHTLLTEKNPKWVGPGEIHPDLVIVSVGGNDYNHHKGKVPTDEEFGSAYEQFLMEIFGTYAGVKVLSVCGQGSPVESEYDPDNNRCSPCPHVESAVSTFKEKHNDMVAEYMFVPCDGSVVTGKGDIGCKGHKNRVGQRKVSDFLLSKVENLLLV